MISHLFYFQLAVLAILGLIVMLHPPGPGESRPRPPRQPWLSSPSALRSKEPKVSEGLTHKPHCALWERDTIQPKGHLPRGLTSCP